MDLWCTIHSEETEWIEHVLFSVVVLPFAVECCSMWTLGIGIWLDFMQMLFVLLLDLRVTVPLAILYALPCYFLLQYWSVPVVLAFYYTCAQKHMCVSCSPDFFFFFFITFWPIFFCVCVFVAWTDNF